VLLVSAARTFFIVKPVLIVEDEPDTREMLVQLVREAGFSVLASDEGRKALELAATIRPCAIVLDLVMDGMDGWQFLDERKRFPALAATPVVVITGTTAPDIDAAAVLTKPFASSELVSTLHKVTRR
jgi:two-component system, chemotaxis family, chemotaxis protein CheY